MNKNKESNFLTRNTNIKLITKLVFCFFYILIVNSNAQRIFYSEPIDFKINTFIISNNTDIPKVYFNNPIEDIVVSQHNKFSFEGYVIDNQNNNYFYIIENKKGTKEYSLNKDSYDYQKFTIQKLLKLNKGKNSVKLFQSSNDTSVLISEKTIIYNKRLNTSRKFALIINNFDYFNETKHQSIRQNSIKLQSCLSNLGFETKCYENLEIEQISNVIDSLSLYCEYFDVIFISLSGIGFNYYNSNYYVCSGFQSKDILKSAYSVYGLINKLNTNNSLKIISIDVSYPLSEINFPENAFVREGFLPLIAPSNFIISYSAAPKKIIESDISNNQYYNTYLSKFLESPKDLQFIFSTVTHKVSKVTGNQQNPWFSYTLAKPYSLFIKN